MPGLVTISDDAGLPGTDQQRFLAEVVARYMVTLRRDDVPLDAPLMVACVLFDLLELAGIPQPLPLLVAVGGEADRVVRMDQRDGQPRRRRKSMFERSIHE